MNLSSFDYHLPKELIAAYPLRQRDQARLLVLNRAKGTIEHRIFKDIVEYLLPGDLVVLNDTKVIPCRLQGARKTGGKVEVLLLNLKHNFTFEALIKPGRIKLDEKVFFNGGSLYCTVTAKNEVTFDAQDIRQIYSLGVVPLPPYIKRPPEDLDREYYQTVYAKSEGSVAAPTAGMHFTESLIKEIKSKGVAVANITLHIGYATFKPVKSEDIRDHKMDKEYFQVNKQAVTLIDQMRPGKGRIFAVGTTSCRVLESYACGNKGGVTSLFIYPGYDFKLVDCLITNFHLPRTTLFMLVSAFAGERLAKNAYQEAIKEKYRFYSYGDAMVIV